MFQKVETDAIASDEDDEGEVVEEYDLYNEDKDRCDKSEEEEWITEDSENEGEKDSGDFSFVNDLVEIKARSSKAFRATLKSVEEVAKKKAEEWLAK